MERCMRLLHPAGAPGPGHLAAPQAPVLPGALGLAHSHGAEAGGAAEAAGHAAAPRQSGVVPSEQQLLMEGDGFKARCCPGCMCRSNACGVMCLEEQSAAGCRRLLLNTGEPSCAGQAQLLQSMLCRLADCFD